MPVHQFYHTMSCTTSTTRHSFVVLLHAKTYLLHKSFALSIHQTE